MKSSFATPHTVSFTWAFATVLTATVLGSADQNTSWTDRRARSNARRNLQTTELT
jgi:hypothetical protein